MPSILIEGVSTVNHSDEIRRSAMAVGVSAPLEVMTPPFSTIEEAVGALRDGQMIIVVDASDRENEGDLVIAAEMVTPEAINFMATHGRGLICAPMLPERLSSLSIPPMVAANTDPRHTAFHVSVDCAAGLTTGISVSERAITIRALADPTSSPSNFVQPGHVFPLAAQAGGVLSRAGHTEAAVDLMILAGLAPAAAICEIAGDSGEMARAPALTQLARQHGLPIVSIEDLIKYRRRNEQLVERTGSARLPLEQADFEVVGFRDLVDGREHIALVLGDVASQPNVLVRMHSECLTGDVFKSQRCDCGAQLQLAIDMIADEGCGIVIYLRGHEGRGIGLMNKIWAYRLQDEGLDTIDANVRIGQPVDDRDYSVGMQILRNFEIDRLRLLTNNPAKCRGLEDYGLAVSRTPLITKPNADNAHYLKTKESRLGHLLDETGVTTANGRGAVFE
jgi:3,4-dihydroxy 2-butanone 4-phosphate synthase/GTP cyclohydrolase II